MTTHTATDTTGTWRTATGAAIYVLGVILALFLLLTVTSAQVETALSEIQSGTPTLTDTRNSLEHIECPAAIGPNEPETIRFSVTNPEETRQSAQITVYAGGSNSSRYHEQCERTATVGPGETRELSCPVFAAGTDGRTLMVEVPGIEAHCGIAIIDGPGGLDGMTALRVGFAVSLIALLAGAGWWFLRQSPHGLFEWLRGSLGILVIAAIMIGAGFTLFVPDVYWKMMVAVFAFWGTLLLMVVLLLLLAAEGIVMRLAVRRESNPSP